MERQAFDYPFFQELTPTTFSRTAPPPEESYVRGTDFNIMGYSGSGNLVDAQVVPTNDILMPPGPTANSSHSGCEATDFPTASVTEDQVALIQRGGSCGGHRGLQLPDESAERPGCRLRGGNRLQRGPGGTHRAHRRRAQRAGGQHPSTYDDLRRRRGTLQP